MPIIEHFYSRPNNYFSASHFLIGFSKCDRLHGHDYSVTLKIRYHTAVDDQFFDFRTINSVIDQVIKKLDHKVLLPGNSSKFNIQSSSNGKNWDIFINEKKYSFPKENVEILKDHTQTTCENIAEYLHSQITKKIKILSEDVKISEMIVVLSETIGNEVSFTSKID